MHISLVAVPLRRVWREGPTGPSISLAARPRARADRRPVYGGYGTTRRSSPRITTSVCRVVAYIRGELERRTLARSEGPGRKSLKNHRAFGPIALARGSILSRTLAARGPRACSESEGRAAVRTGYHRYAPASRESDQVSRPTDRRRRVAPRSLRASLIHECISSRDETRVCVLAALFRRPSARARASVSRLSRLPFR